jgi:hypothetical protein
MHNSVIESLMVGCGIALGVLLIQALTQDAPATTQLLALLAAGIVLFCIQLGLALRRSRHSGTQPDAHARPAPRRALTRRARRNPFFRELTHDWTGLDDHTAEQDPAGPYAPDDLDDELWGEPPLPKREQAIASDQRPRKND